MNVLVTVASKHGATAQIGEVIADTLRNAGLPVATRQPEEVTSVDEYDAVVFGSAVYAGRWLAQAILLRAVCNRTGHPPDMGLLERSSWQPRPA